MNSTMAEFSPRPDRDDVPSPAVTRATRTSTRADSTERLAALGRRAEVTDAYRDVGHLTDQRLRELPVTEKAAVRADLGRFQTPVAFNAELQVTSSGTTATPTPYRRTAAEMKDNAGAVADRLRIALPGRHRVLSLLDHNRYAVGPFIEAVSAALGAPLHRGFPYRGGALEPEPVVSALNAYESDVLVATPGVIIDLEDAWDRQGVDIKSVTRHLRSVLMLGQTVTGGLRHHVSAAWSADAAIFSYGSSETGTVATGCRAGVLHAFDERYVLEVRTDDGLLPFSVATRGEMIVTPLHSDATVLLRYATGDTVRRVACGCGTPGTAFVVEGRQDDVIQGPEGPLGAEEVEAAVYAMPGAIDYLLEVDQRERVRNVRLLVARHMTNVDTASLEAALGAPVEMVDEIPAAARSGALVKSWRLTRTMQKWWAA